ncbi:LANO_0H11518g1_1 [Lachancea nothofagi CBS 11611]|uniref:LANO_0H11518g1_1 n=1 Tax=Lachancea nothofagi CBS 11611 TaxID=1266666 RepID=A0A1G4KM97_9SACH|nr:LANO_0H11518g1_1 [Lachancea nothofagi CBS 11611]
MDDVNTHHHLRPYYDADTFNAGYSSVFKPDQGVVDNHGFSIASKLNIMSQTKSKFSKTLREPGILSQLTTGFKAQVRDADTTAEEAQKTLNDMEWNDLLNWRSWRSIGTNLLEQFLRRYSRHLFQQPFEISRLLLQVGEFQLIKVDDQSKIALELSDRGSGYEEREQDEDDDEEIEYFPRADPDTSSLSDTPQSPNKHAEREHTAPTLTKKILPDSLHTMDVLNAVMEEEGTRGLWRANNTTFIYNFLSVTLDAWFTGLISPFLQIPDPYFIDIVHSTDTRKSIFLTIGASVFTGLVLLPVDLIRTRLTITSVKVGNRSLRNLLSKWSWRKNASELPLDMVLLNIGHSLTSTVFTKLTGVLLYHQFRIDKFSQTMWYNTLELLSEMLELFVKLPVENLLRRSQTSYLLRNRPSDPFPVVRDNLIVTPRNYNGIYSTLQDTNRVHELWRGWRLGLLSVLCGYGLKMMNVEAMEEEKF